MKKQILVMAILMVSVPALAQYPGHVAEVKLTNNGSVTAKGNLSSGSKLANLDWASTSSMACFPATQNTKFNGNHVYFWASLPKKGILNVTVIPDDVNANMSIYGYQVGLNNFRLPPDISSCIACEAEHKWDRPKVNKTQDHTRTIEFNSTTESYNILIGITGADGLSTGGFSVKFDLVADEPNTAVQQPLKRYTAASEANKILSYKGKLDEGVFIHDLSWASTSSMACFPATQNSKFNGKHVVYITTLPPKSEMTVTVVPDDANANMSIWGYQVGTSNNAMPPEIQSCVSCEAEHKWDRPKAGKTQDHTRSIFFNSDATEYKIVIGVCGAEKLDKGGFTLKIQVKQ
jgi:hypothetical protein